MNSKENQNLFNFSILPKEEQTANEAIMKHPGLGLGLGSGSGSGPVQSTAGPFVARSIEEIVDLDNLGLSLRNPYYELFRRHKAPIVNDDGTVYCAQKGKIVDRVPRILAIGGGVPLHSGERAPPLISGSYYNPQAIDVAIAMGGVTQNPNPNFKGRFSVVPSVHINGQSDQQVPSKHYNNSDNDIRSIVWGLDRVLAGSGRAAKRGRWFSVAKGEGIVADGESVEADNNGGNVHYDVSVIDLSLKLGPPN